MNIVTNIEKWRSIRKTLTNKTIGFVPTMGNLHEGHLSLCKKSMSENEVTIVSIFINPTQFNQTSDFEGYTRTLEQDINLLNVDYVLLPIREEIYPDDYQIQIHEMQLSLELEGAYRPGHFTGMLTIVLKLLNLVQATRAYFGEKDYQQLLLIKKMSLALFLPTEVIGCQTIRATDGLALSSRNSRLTWEEREKAKIFPQLLNSDLSLEEIIRRLKLFGFKVDYIIEKWQRRLGAVWIGKTRLIDNFELKT